MPAAYDARSKAIVREFEVSVLADYGGEKNPMAYTLDLPPAAPIPCESGMQASAKSSEKT